MAAAASEQQSSNGPVKKSMREKAVERRNINKEHNSNFKAGYIPIDEDRLHKTGLRGRKGNLAICVIVLLFILAVINLIITLVIWAVIRIGPNGCDSMEFHESGLLRFKQISDMGVIHPLYKSTVGGRRNEDLVITGNNQPIVFQQGTTKLSVEKDKTSITSDIGMEFVDPRTQNTLFSTDYETHEFHLPNGVKILNVQKASTERITSNATSDLNIKVDGRAIVRGNEGVFIMGKMIEFRMGGDMELKAENSIILNGTVMVSTSRLPSSSYGEQFNNGDWVRYKLCMCADDIMANSYLSVMALVLLLNYTGSSGFKSQETDSFRNLPFLETLNLNGNIIHYIVLDICKSEDWSEKHRKVYTYGLLPFLKVLAIERNNLSAIPRGLGMLQSLRSVHLSSNEILQIEQNDFHNCSQIKNIYLQNNKITKIHPDAFKNLKKLQVLDLSNNVMTTILPEMFIELNIFNLEERHLCYTVVWMKHGEKKKSIGGLLVAEFPKITGFLILNRMKLTI
ncbi:beta-sarcoglycan [Alligator mississippiensis]|uniref:Beta-sarcoglycan n=1 Tax=Alligator mississippiensis TaxID=8496 RepID=A0A151PAJ5_ALLMI|nr:beta-sarcoglycan [Alligator mississippiensis]